MALLFGKSKYSTLSGTPVNSSSHHSGLTATEPLKKKEIPEGLWEKCKKCGEMNFTKKREENLNVCPRCGCHYPMTAQQRIALLTDEGTFKEVDALLESVDTLKFEGVASYTEKLIASKEKTGLKDAIVCGLAKLKGIPYALGVMDFRFLGASMGAVVGEKVTRLVELATAKKLPLVIVTASGGARMYEGMISLMQMAKTSAALERHQEQGLSYIVVMTHPTTAGVTASFASLGDLIVAEPEALIGFAGPRVIKDTTQAHLPEGFQTSEFLLKKGLIDRIIDRKNLRDELALCLEYFTFCANSKDDLKKKASR